MSKSKWVKSQKQKEWHFVEDFNFYDYPLSGATAICGQKYEINGFKGAEIISEVMNYNDDSYCAACLDVITELGIKENE